jgi:hypothetical protein
LETELVCFAGDKEADNQTEQAEDGREDLNDEDLDEAVESILSVIFQYSRVS